MDQIELDRLLDRGAITQEEWSTGDQVYGLLYRAGMLGVSKSTLNVSGSSGDPQHLSERKSDALLMVGDLINHLDEECGQEVRRRFMNMLILDTPIRTDKHIEEVKHVLLHVDKAFG